MPRKKPITVFNNEEDKLKEEAKKEPRKSKKRPEAEQTAKQGEIPKIRERERTEKKESGNDNKSKRSVKTGRVAKKKNEKTIHSSMRLPTPKNAPSIKIKDSPLVEQTPALIFPSVEEACNPNKNQSFLLDSNNQSLFGAPDSSSELPQNNLNQFGSSSLFSGNPIGSELCGSINNIKEDASSFRNNNEDQKLSNSLENTFFKHEKEKKSSDSPKAQKKIRAKTGIKKAGRKQQIKSVKKKIDESDFEKPEEKKKIKDVPKNDSVIKTRSGKEHNSTNTKKGKINDNLESQGKNFTESEKLSELELNIKENLKQTDEEEKVKRINKENAKVDSKVPNAEQFTIYERGNKKFTAALLYTDFDMNSNKFFMIQLLEDIFDSSYFMLFIRHGRVGAEGKIFLRYYNDVGKAVDAYEEKFSSKIDRGFLEIEIDYTINSKQQQEKSLPAFRSNLDGRLQNLIKIIFNIDKMREQLLDNHIDIKKLSLEKLSKATLSRGYLILKDIEDVIEGRRKGNLREMSNDFFSIIPHNFGSKPLSQFTIDTTARVQELMELMRSLSEINIASQLSQLRGLDNCAGLDSNYFKLRCEITPLESSTNDYRIVENYFSNSIMDMPIKILEIFKLKREKEDGKFKNFLGNPTLLWHGSRVSNIAGILSQGLRIAPKESPMTGFTYGKGIYFSDRAIKAAEFCHPDPSENIGILLLCRVTLGHSRKLYEPIKDATELLPGYHSLLAVGKSSPHPSYSTIYENMLIPNGETISTLDIGASTQYNEYVIFDESQIKLEYLVLCQFNR